MIVGTKLESYTTPSLAEYRKMMGSYVFRICVNNLNLTGDKMISLKVLKKILLFTELVVVVLTLRVRLKGPVLEISQL